MPSASLEQAIQYKLLNTSTLTNLIGQNNVYFVDAPQGTPLPFVVFYNVVQNADQYIMCEKYSGQPTLQFSVWTNDQYSGYNIMSVIFTALQWFSGIVDGLQIDHIKCNGIQVIRDDSQDDLYHTTMDAEIWYIMP